MRNSTKNLLFLRKKTGLTQDELAIKLGMVRSTYANWEKGRITPPIDTYDKVLKFYNVKYEDFIYNDLSKIDMNVPTSMQRSKNLFVPVKAQASYMNGWNDEVYQSKLKPVSIPGIPDHVEARTFEVGGMSMFPLICEGDLLVCLRHERSDEYRIDDVFVFITKNNGLLVKFIRIQNESTVRLVSHNAYEFAPIDLAQEDIIEVWKAKYKITRNFSAGTSSENRQLQTRIERLEDLIRDKLK